jgi:hypothetical protein
MSMPHESAQHGAPHPSPQVGRGAARNVDADGRLITSAGVHGCANLPANEWSDEMDGPVR